jgi:chromate transport protein ChrA
MNEYFVSNSENDEIVKNIFITIGFTVVSIIIVSLLAWGYYSYDNKSLFIIIYSIMVLIYCIVIISIVAIDKNNYDTTSYTIIFSTTIFTIFVTFFVFVLFIYKFFTMKNSNERVINYTYR